MIATRIIPVAATLSSLILLLSLYIYDAPITGHWGKDAILEVLRNCSSVILVAIILRLCLKHYATSILFGAAVVYLCIGIGVLQIGSTLLLLLSSYMLGRRLLIWAFPSQPQQVTPALFCGLAVYLTVFGVMIHFPVNFRVVYCALLAYPLVSEVIHNRIDEYLQKLAEYRIAWIATTQQIPYPIFVIAISSLIFLFRYAFFPTLGFDDNALHLGLWSQLRHEHIYSFDYVSQVWEVAPFAVDLLHAIINSISDNDARGATNAVLLLIVLRQLWVILDYFKLDIYSRLLLLALFISTPLTGYMLLTLQTELFMAVLAVSATRLSFEIDDWCSPHGAALLAMAALCCATKLTGAWLGITLLTAVGVRLWLTKGLSVRASLRSTTLMCLFAVFLAALAFNAYFTAWIKTGNPVFPLYNGIFRSPYFGAYNFTDQRWINGFSFASYWELFFHTSKFYESQDFVAGFQYLFLLPLSLITLLTIERLRRHAAVVLLLPLLCFGIPMFAAIQYWRYEFSIFPIATLSIASLLVPQYSTASLLLVRSALALCIALNFQFYSGVNGYMNLTPRHAYSTTGKNQMLERYMGARILNDWININNPGSTVLYPEQLPFGATLSGTPIYPTWYSPSNDVSFHSITNDGSSLAFFNDKKIDYAISHINDTSLPGTVSWELRHFLSRYALPIVQAGDLILYRFVGSEIPYIETYSDATTYTIGTEPQRLGSFSAGNANALRYNAEFACADDAGYFAAQINWDNGEYYYHEVPCSAAPLQFIEAMPLPPGVNGGDLWARVTSGQQAATLNSLSIESIESIETTE